MQAKVRIENLRDNYFNQITRQTNAERQVPDYPREELIYVSERLPTISIFPIAVRNLPDSTRYAWYFLLMLLNGCAASEALSPADYRIETSNLPPTNITLFTPIPF